MSYVDKINVSGVEHDINDKRFPKVNNDVTLNDNFKATKVTANSMETLSMEVNGGLIVGDDANAAIGGDLVVHGLTEVQNLLAYGHVETETLTAAGEQITAEKPVVEVMQGYGASIPSNTGWEINNVYTSACKNGNKLTLVCAVHITKALSDASASPALVTFTIPSSIGSKIYPEDEVFPVNEHICDISPFTSFGPNGGVVVYAQIRKLSNTSLIVYLTGEGSKFAVGEKNYLRYEITFLLSDGLIQ